MNKNAARATVLTIIMMAASLSGCGAPPTSLDHSNVPIRELTGDEISRLPIGEIVRFPAVVIKGLTSDCIEIFTREDFAKYEADGKYAIASQLSDSADFYENLPGTYTGVVTGRMTRVKDDNDPTRFCGIVTGSVFEIVSVK